ncbi:MAG: tRNA pseudouridine(38-40) synthase TruA [Acidobacteria bacterium]|nr:tRNA pseudouridine(38-40) synthase TruA [Acidobacteriota bacterium]
MKTFKIVLEYDGTRYSGWAEQTNAPRTVMGELRKAAENVFAAPVELMGAGRTDAGVHAAAQVAHLRVRSAKVPPPARLLRALNDELPADIAVLEVDEAPPKFHARHDAVSRSYVYQISRRKTAFSKKFVWWVKEPLDIARMAEAAALIAGRHDFARFRAKDPTRPGESSLVVVASATIEEQDDLVLFHIEASHFIWRMVRRLAGCLVKVGKGELTVAEFGELLAGGGARHDVAAWTAPASGLFLEKVNYARAPNATPGPATRASSSAPTRSRS